MEGWQRQQQSHSHGIWPCEVIHFVVDEICRAEEHVRAGLVQGGNPHSLRRRSKPLGLDSPTGVSMYRAQGRDEARFFGEFGGGKETGPSSLWMMQELQMLEGFCDARRGAGFSCQLGNADHRHPLAILSNLASCCDALHMWWPKFQHVVKNECSFLEYQGPLPNTCPCKHSQ